MQNLSHVNNMEVLPPKKMWTFPNLHQEFQILHNFSQNCEKTQIFVVCFDLFLFAIFILFPGNTDSEHFWTHAKLCGLTCLSPPEPLFRMVGIEAVVVAGFDAEVDVARRALEDGFANLWQFTGWTSWVSFPCFAVLLQTHYTSVVSWGTKCMLWQMDGCILCVAKASFSWSDAAMEHRSLARIIADELCA